MIVDSNGEDIVSCLWKLVSSLAVVLLVLTLGAPLCAQSNTSFQYFYDNNGQLIKVIDSSSNEIDYAYDSVGN